MIARSDPFRMGTGGPARAALSVGQRTAHLARVVATDEILADVWVRGEVCNLSRPASGHVYFGLKDSECCLKAVLWRSLAAFMPFRVETGALVLARGRVEVYGPRSEYSLIVAELQPDGIGALHLALEQLKAALSAEGLFDAERKRSLPRFPRRVGVVTSPSGAAVQDICAVLQRGPYPPEVVLVPAVVHGSEAPASIVAAIERANRRSGADVLIVGRGGGSAEDLWAFNTEPGVRAIAGSRRPVISAVGHETDTTLADHAADERALTPTAAAERIAQLREEQIGFLAAVPRGLNHGHRRVLAESRQRLQLLRMRRPLADPAELVARRRVTTDTLHARLCRGLERHVQRDSARLTLLGSQLDSLSPLAVLQRGFARVLRVADGLPVRSRSDVSPGARVRVRLSDGGFEAVVTDVLSDA